MVRYADKFMALNNRNKAAVTLAMLAGAAAVVYLLVKLVAMFRKESSLKGTPSKMPVMTRRMPVMNRRRPVMEPSLARTHRRHHEELSKPRRDGWKPIINTGSFAAHPFRKPKRGPAIRPRGRQGPRG